MKKLNIMLAIAFGSLVYNKADAQVHVGIGLNFGVRPVYAPVVVRQQPVYQDNVYYNEDNDGDNDYYYLPEVEAYYSVARRRYFYNNGGSWVSAAYLPGAYRNYDWRSARRYQVHAYRPFIHNNFYRARYGGYEGRRNWNSYYRGHAYRDYNAGWNRGRHFDNGNHYGWNRHQDFNRGDRGRHRGWNR